MGHHVLVTSGAILLWALAVLAAVFAEAFWLGPPQIRRGDRAAIEDHLVDALTEAAAHRQLGSAALVLVHDGKVSSMHGFGVANAATRTPVAPDQTLFLLASVSKAVTAWGVMRLVEAGTLHLDEPVMRHLTRWRFPGSEGYRDRVTIRHLLSHTGGLDDGLGYGGVAPGESVQTLEESLMLTQDSTVGAPRAVRVTSEPGTAMAYSGGGYTILQLLIEEVTHQPFAQYMKDAVLGPLGMTTASFDLGGIVAEGRAQQIAPSFDRELRSLPPRRYTASAAVALYATPQDLAKFVLAFSQPNPVLSPQTLAAMWSPQPGTSGSWGLGHALFVEIGSGGGHIVGHDGGTGPAWGAVLRVNPATGNGVVVLVSGGRTPVSRLGDDWIYWETGKVTWQARRDILFRRLAPASVAILLGAVAIALWKRITAWLGRTPASAS